MSDFLNRYEGIVIKKTEVMYEVLCEVFPVATWYLFKTNHGRVFTCKDTYKSSKENEGKKWKYVEFDSIEEGRHFPFL